ncbi:probable 18S rRNA (guanine-N(7))-methyltransferase [Olea europaea subsp. europaea]|uniref:Probable 18S rRNA (Guanine-N(7))-methyltransferase n=1 Tax=Olea europaea subsp. europaea TaxID=158383 RepID=A0A8S0SX67_OLEEU|nr:probable 18S rRNA (guanine-N(7))-methyltransferase [Olea europaea subsp. europaea]
MGPLFVQNELCVGLLVNMVFTVVITLLHEEKVKMVRAVLMKTAAEMKIINQHRPRKKQKLNKKMKGREWVLRKKEQRRRKGTAVPADTKYTARKRKARF